jgi:hypothetical protein
VSVFCVTCMGQAGRRSSKTMAKWPMADFQSRAFQWHLASWMARKRILRMASPRSLLSDGPAA